jgi:YD repeat-containing protein
MKAGLHLFLCVVFCSVAAAQSIDPRNEFKGKVKTIRIDLAYLDDSGTPDERGRHLSALRAFDINRDLTMSEDFYAYGKISYGKDAFSYDAANRVTQKVHEINGSSYTTQYTYNDAGQLSGQNREGQGYVSKYNYDASGRPREEKRFTLEGVANGRREFFYDTTGRLVRRVSYNSKGSVDSEESWQYDAAGHLASETYPYGTKTYDLKGNLISEFNNKKPGDDYYRKVVYEHDETDHLVKREEYDNQGLWTSYSYAYKYDTQGNWIEQVTKQVRRGEPDHTWITYRVIVYY